MLSVWWVSGHVDSQQACHAWRLLLGENEPILFSLVWFCSFVCFRELSPRRPIMSHCSFPEHELASFMCYSIWSLVLLSVRSIPGFSPHCLVTFVVRETRERASWWVWLLPMWSLCLHQKSYIVFVVRKLTPGNFFVICLQIVYHLEQKTLFSQSYFVDLGHIWQNLEIIQKSKAVYIYIYVWCFCFCFPFRKCFNIFSLKQHLETKFCWW